MRKRYNKVCTCGETFEGAGQSKRCKMCAKLLNRNRAKVRKAKFRKLKGYCWDCCKQASGKYCEPCRKKRRQKEASRRMQWEQMGLCYRCGGKFVSDQNVSKACERCLFKSVAKSTMKGAVSWKELQAKFLAQKGICPYILKPIYPGKNASLDHKIPSSRGGANSMDNVEWIEVRINFLKGNMTKEEFQAWRNESGITFPCDK